MDSLADRWPPRDRLGRKQPHRFSLPSFLSSPGIGMVLAQAFEQGVPGDFVAEDVDDEGHGVSVIACPCGEEPIIPAFRTAECACGRFYLNLGTEVRVFRPDEIEPGLPDVGRPDAAVD